MALTHKLTYNNTEYVISEPIGFDDLQSTIKRHEYHGMGAEVSLGNLEFYGEAYEVIMEAYQDDIDSEVLYEVSDGDFVIYSGKIDLSTCSVKQGDYRSVSAKVGEIGVKTTFNNRTDKDVDVDDPKTIDGDFVDTPTWQSLHIPMKHLLYTNSVKQKTDVQYSSIPGGTTSGSTSNIPYAEYVHRYINVKLNGDYFSEFSQFSDETNTYETDSTDNITPQYISAQDHTTQYGSNTVANIDAYFDIDVYVYSYSYQGSDNTIYFSVAAKDYNGNEIAGTEINIARNTTDRWVNVKCSLSGNLSAANSIKFYLKCRSSHGRALFQFKIKKGSYYRMKMYDNLAEDSTSAKLLLVHDALNIVTHAISENGLAVKSDWYRTPESHWNAGSVGGGALKALTNGYKIRNLYTEGDTKRNMPLSFKALIESLSALDCIGWGFSIEDGNLCLRVERWDWFYKNDVILTLQNVAEITTDIYTDFIPTELKIGYKKYATLDQYNSIESPHGTRNFINGIKALTKAITAESEFVADNYAIEETRRARTQKDETEESTYDENIFVFELTRFINNVRYVIGHTALNATGVGRTQEFINAKLTPRHMAARWRDYLFATNNSTPFRFTTGEINYQASFGCYTETDTISGESFNSLKPFATTNPQKENDNITYSHAKFQAEKVSFSYPISVDEYKDVLENPYGLIRLTNSNGDVVKEGWIMDFKYKIEDGMTEFTLLTKYNQN